MNGILNIYLSISSSERHYEVVTILSILEIKQQGMTGYVNLLESRQLVPEGVRTGPGDSLPGDRRRQGSWMGSRESPWGGQPAQEGKVGLGPQEVAGCCAGN